MKIASKNVRAALPAAADPGPKKAYMTTAKAGWWVARQKVPGEFSHETVNGETTTTHTPKVGHVLWLTAVQAAYDLSQGAIALMNPQPASSSVADVEAAIAAQAH